MAAPAETKQLQKIPPIDYTSRDFRSIKADLVRTIPFYTPEWTDLNETDLGIVLLDLIAHSSDVLHFYLDRNANEAFLPTAITRRSVINLLKLIDFEMRPASPASADLLFTIPVLGGNLTIPTGTKVQTAPDATGTPVFFETVEDLIIPAGDTAGTVGASEGETKEEPLPPAEGVPNTRVALAGNPIIDGTLELFVDEGIGFELWQEVETFAESQEDSKHFTTNRDENENVTIFFGDNVQGKIPVAGSATKARYRVGGGARGNVGFGTINAVVTPITFLGNPVAVEVTNSLAASGGEDRQSIEEAKILGPRSLRALNRAVTAEDFETLAEQFPGVAKAKVAIASGPAPVPVLGCCCCVALIIAPEGGGLPSSVLKNDLLAFFEERKMIGTCIKILDPTYVPIDMTGDVHVATNFDVEAVAVEVASRLAAFYDLAGESIDFGTPVFISDIFRLIDETPGVDHVDLTKLTRRPAPVKELWPTNGATFKPFCGSAAPEGAEPCEDAKDEVWTVIFVTPTTFTIRDSVGIIYGPFTVNTQVLCEQTGNRVTMCIEPGVDPMCPADRATFRTSPKLNNVPMDEIEIPIQGVTTLTFVGGARSQKVCP